MSPIMAAILDSKMAARIFAAIDILSISGIYENALSQNGRVHFDNMFKNENLPISFWKTFSVTQSKICALWQRFGKYPSLKSVEQVKNEPFSARGFHYIFIGTYCEDTDAF